MKRRIQVIVVLLVIAAGIVMWLRVGALNTDTGSKEGTEREAVTSINRNRPSSTGVRDESKRRRLQELATRAQTDSRGIDREEARDEIEQQKKLGALKWKKAPELYNEMHNQEAKDDRWQDQVMDLSKEFFAAEAVHGTDVMSVDCRQSLCKAVFKHVGESAFERFHTDQAPIKAVWAENDQYGHHIDHEDGSVTSVLYFSRYGDHTPLHRFQEKLRDVLDTEGKR